MISDVLFNNMLNITRGKVFAREVLHYWIENQSRNSKKSFDVNWNWLTLRRRMCVRLPEDWLVTSTDYKSRDTSARAKFYAFYVTGNVCVHSLSATCIFRALHEDTISRYDRLHYETEKFLAYLAGLCVSVTFRDRVRTENTRFERQ